MHNYKPITDRKIRLAVVGCGRISKNHFASIEKHADRVELAAVCDTDQATLAAHAKQYRVPGYLSLAELLEREQVDLVVLCTPSGMHPDQAVLAAGSGVHVMTEKPMATRWHETLLPMPAR